MKNSFFKKLEAVMHFSFIDRKRLYSPLLILFGMAAIVVAVTADLFFGYRALPHRLTASLIGFVLLLAGVVQAIRSRREGISLSAREQRTNFLLMAFWFGLLTGMGEIGAHTMYKFAVQRFLYLGQHVVWMAPLANVFLFTVVGVILWLLARRWPRLISVRVVAFILAFLSFFSLLLVFAKIHRLASLVLAAGLAAQSARMITMNVGGFQRLVRRSVGWMMALVLLLSVCVHGWLWLAEHRTLAKLPSAPSDAPNVLLIVLDTVRAKSFSLYGYDRRTTPQLEKFAKNGVFFKKAIAPASWTIPTHAGMFTGRFPHELSLGTKGRAQPLDATYTTLAEVLTSHGYRTAGFVGNQVYTSYETGLNRGFTHYEDYPVSAGQIIMSASLGRQIVQQSEFRRLVAWYDILSRKNAAEVNRDFLKWISLQDQQPFFAFLNYFDAHQPYLPPEPFDVKFGANKPRGKLSYGRNFINILDWRTMTGKEIQAEQDAYDGAIAYIDHQINLLLEELQKRELLENTLIIITSDHGEQFGEHNFHGHGNSLYLPLLHVPLLISFNSTLPATTVLEPVTLCDIPATILDLIGLGEMNPFPGESLARYWERESWVENRAPDMLLSEVLVLRGSRKGYMKSLISEKFHYIKNSNGSEELYDLSDSDEMHDLSNSAKGRHALKHFRLALDTMLAHSQYSN